MLLSLAAKKEGVAEKMERVFDARMYSFEHLFDYAVPKRRARRQFSDYTTNNCEEAWGGRP